MAALLASSGHSIAQTAQGPAKLHQAVGLEQVHSVRLRQMLGGERKATVGHGHQNRIGMGGLVILSGAHEIPHRALSNAASRSTRGMFALNE